MSELLPCPFGCDEAPLIVPEAGDGDFFVGCRQCGAGFYHDSKEAAITAWNRRAPPEPSAGWRGISTAPKDGTRVDLWVIFETGPRRVTATYYDAEIGEWWVSDHYHTGQYVHRPDPTRWMPLPSPPSEAAKSASGPVGELEEHKALSPLVGQGEEGSSRAMKGGSPPLRAAKSDSQEGH